MTETKLTLAWGYNAGIPAEAKAVWGARLIWPDDFVIWDHQDLVAHDDESKIALISWLNGTSYFKEDGAIKKMINALKTPITLGLHASKPAEAVIYEDDLGKIVGNSNGSTGYVYVCGYLKWE